MAAVGECPKAAITPLGRKRFLLKPFLAGVQVRHLRTDASEVLEDGDAFLRTQFKGGQRSLSKPPDPSPISVPPEDTGGDINKPASLFPLYQG